MALTRRTKKTQFSKTDRISIITITEKSLKFEYEISAKPSNQWWAIYRGVIPDGSYFTENKENRDKDKWKKISENNATDKKGTVEINDYEFTPGAIYTLALFKDEKENAYDLAGYVVFRVPTKDNTLSNQNTNFELNDSWRGLEDDILSNLNLNISEDKKTITFDYQLSAEEAVNQWWVIYQGVMPSWDNLKKSLKKGENWKYFWDDKTDKKGTVSFDYEFTPGAIYTLALFKDEKEDAYDLADYFEFRVPPEKDDNDDKLFSSSLKTSEKNITFDYHISAPPDNQWWVIYSGVMPSWDNLNKYLLPGEWRWISSYKTDEEGKGTVNFDFNFQPGIIYTLALFKDEKENAYELADYHEFAFQPAWTVLVGENSYCYCACNSTADNKQEHNSSHTMNVEEGAPYFYAVLTKDDDTVDFPDGAVLTIEDPDGTKYDRDIREENQLVMMSGSSVRCLIVKDPKPGDWKMTMTAPEGLGFHCECNTVPSKDPYETITNALGKRELAIDKRDTDNLTGWIGTALIGIGIVTAFGWIPVVGQGLLAATLGGSLISTGAATWWFGKNDSPSETAWYTKMTSQVTPIVEKLAEDLKNKGFTETIRLYSYLIGKNFSKQEWEVLKREPLRILPVMLVYAQVYKVTGHILDDDEQNAVRHAFWQCLLKKRFGADLATKIGDAHEEGRPGHKADNLADEINNLKGKQLADEAISDVECIKRVNEMWKARKLQSRRDLEFHAMLTSTDPRAPIHIYKEPSTDASVMYDGKAGDKVAIVSYPENDEKKLWCQVKFKETDRLPGCVLEEFIDFETSHIS